jgi:hypothetical protein
MAVTETPQRALRRSFGTDGNDESAPYGQTSTPAKKIRVVSSFELS